MLSTKCTVLVSMFDIPSFLHAILHTCHSTGRSFICIYIVNMLTSERMKHPIQDRPKHICP